jgi:hypothetical protein
MERDNCPHGLSERRAAVTTTVTSPLIAPSSKTHFRGCTHKGDDPDYRQWGKLDTPNAWQRLGNGESLKATGGQHPDRVATTRCQSCVAHGPW